MERELKLNTTTLDQWNSGEEWKELKGYAKTFLSLMALSIIFVLIIGLGSYMRHEVAAKPSRSSSDWGVRSPATGFSLA